MDAIALLKADHDKVKKLLTELETTTERGVKTREALFATIKGELTVHEVIEGLRSRFGQRLRYVFRHLPVDGSDNAVRAAELAELAAETSGRFWQVH